MGLLRVRGQAKILGTGNDGRRILSRTYEYVHMNFQLYLYAVHVVTYMNAFLTVKLYNKHLFAHIFISEQICKFANTFNID